MLRRTFQLRSLYQARCKLSQFLKYESYRSVCLRNSKDIHRNLASLAHSYQETSYDRDKFDSVTVESVDEDLSKMDQMAKRTGYVNKFQVRSVYNKIKALGKASSIQSLYLLRCCGALMCDEEAKKRTELANDIWKTIEKFKIPVDASHYNALMKVYLENEHTFLPTDFLSTMEKNRIEPNRVTYQRLIEKYCQDGDLNGASVILEHMKEKGIAVNEAVFNSLIRGHVKSGDFDGARSMFDVMRRTQLTPGPSTYLALACGYAEKGDIDGVISTLKEAEQASVFLGNNDLLSLMYSLIVSGHEDKVVKILNYLGDLRYSRKEFVNLTHKLLSRGFSEEAYNLVKLISSRVEFDVGAVEYIKHYVALGRPVEEVLERCQEMSSRLSNPQHFYLSALKSALNNCQENCVIELFKECLKIGVPVRCHYFWPIIVSHAKAKNEKGILNVLKTMTSMGVMADSDTYLDYIFPGISTEDVESVLKAAKDSGQSEYGIVSPLFRFYCRSGNYKNAAHLWETNEVEINSYKSLLNEIAETYQKDVDNENLLKLLKCLSSVPIPEKELNKEEFIARKDVVGRLFVQLSNLGKLSKQLLTDCYKMEFGVSNRAANIICDNIGRSDPELIQIVRSIQYNAPLPQLNKDMGFKHPREMDLDSLEKHVVELKESGTTARVALRHLLVEYCKQRNLEKILATKEELDNDGFIYSPALYALMVEAFVAVHDLDRAQEIFSKLKEDFPDTNLDNVKAINYAILLIRFGKNEEAIKFLKDECRDINFARKDLLLRNVKKLLTVAAETGDSEFTNEIFQIFSSKLEISSPQNMVESLVKAHLNRGELENAVQEYVRCVKEHNFTPCSSMLFKKCISMNEFDKLQKVVDAAAMVDGRIPTLRELAFSFIECGQVQEARKVFQNLGDRIDFVHLEKFGAKLVKEQKVTELENLILATKGLTHIDRDRMYFHLLTLYVQDNDCDKALELWNCIQEENIQPSPRTLHVLAKLLEKNDQPIPFVVPGGKIETDDEVMIAGESKSEAQAYASELMANIQSANTDGIVATLNKMKKGHIRLLPTDLVTNMVDVLIQKNMLRDITSHVQMMSYLIEKSRVIFKPVMQKYAESGNVEVFTQLMQVLPDFSLKTMGFNFYHNKAHIVSGKIEELITSLEQNIGSSIKLFSLNGFMEMLKLCPEIEPRAIKLVDRFAKEENFDIPRRALWVYYFVNERFSDADNIFKEYPQLFTNMDILASQVFRNIKTSNNETVARKLVEFISSFNISPVYGDRAYSCLLDVLVNKGDHDAAVEMLEEAKKKDVPMSKFSRKSLLALKTFLESNNKPVPFDISVQDDSGSSSDSD